MKYLFIHQSFPSQYRHIIRKLSSEGIHQIVALSINSCNEILPKDITFIQYSVFRGNISGIPTPLLDLDSKLIRAEACANECIKLRDTGFTPDLICAHSGWGEALLVKDIWPSIPLLSYQEFFYNPIKSDCDFDPNVQPNMTIQESARIRLKNANPLLMLHAADWNITPTHFQLSQFPSQYASQFSVIHDGIDTTLASPLSIDTVAKTKHDLGLNPMRQVITFVNRNIEPYRGCHTFIRSIPLIQELNPDVEILVVGHTTGVSYGAPAPNNSWLNTFLPEIEGQYDKNRVHFLGSLDYSHYLRVLKISSCHVYLTYPFVLSWSLLEAMSISIPIVASATLPVEEVIKDRYNGLLVDFFSTHELASAITSVLSQPELSKYLGDNARKTICDKFDVNVVLPQHISLIQSLIN